MACTGGSSSISTRTSTRAQSDDGSTWQRLRHARCKGTIHPSANLLVRIIMMMIMMTMIVMVNEVEIKLSLNSYLHLLFLAWTLVSNKNTSELRPINGNED